MDFFIKSARAHHIEVVPLNEQEFTEFLKKATPAQKAMIGNSAFMAKAGQSLFLNNEDGTIDSLLVAVSDPVGLYDSAHAVKAIQARFDGAGLENTSFALKTDGFETDEIALLYAGWGLGCYQYTRYKKSDVGKPALVRDKNHDDPRINALIDSITLIRDLITTPANDMGPQEIEDAARALVKKYDATMTVIDDKKLKTDFPLIFGVGDSSPRRPRLIDMKWGDENAPKITLVGKGVSFDTGGLNLKPTAAMAFMKKDMGGAAHVLGLANMIMAMGLKIRLRVLIPAVENSVSGVAFRPGDVLQSRKGLTVENTNTDAEGRLILADSLTYACEENPDIVIDYATLTGSARAALGHEIPPFFTNDKSLVEPLANASEAQSDPIWHMPLWESYHSLIESPIADLVNSAKQPGDLIYSALFLQKFLLNDTSWVHLDVYAWENNGKAGCPAGGTDMGMRAVYAMLEEKYGR
jgi:leucyl aminopeptidase